MTDATINRYTTDGFWTRVRLALGGRTPAVETGPARNDFEIAFATGWRSAAAGRAPLALLLIEIDELADYFAAYGPAEADVCFAEVSETLAAVLPRPEDSCLPVAPGRFGVVLPKLPAHEAQRLAAAMAQSVRQLGRPHKASHAGTVTVSMGLAVTLPEGGSFDNRLVEAAQQALRRAQRRGKGRLEVVDLRPRQMRQAA